MRNLYSYENSQSSTGDLPFGNLQNETAAGNDDGTTILAEQMQDLYYSLYQVLQLAGVNPNGTLENGNTQKQFLSALSNVAPLIYNSTTTYNKNSLVLYVNNNEINIYESLVSSNKSALSDSTKWKLLTKINSSGVFCNANLYSPNLSGVPVAPTAASGTNTTQIATTAFVKTAVSAITQSTALVPNYNKGVTASNNYTATENGWLLCRARLDSYQSHVRINGVSVFAVEPQWLNDWSGWKLYGMVFIGKGQKVTLDGNAEATFYPFIGA